MDLQDENQSLWDSIANPQRELDLSHNCISGLQKTVADLSVSLICLEDSFLHFLEEY